MNDTLDSYTLSTVHDTIQAGPFDITIDHYPGGVHGYIQSQARRDSTIYRSPFTGAEEICFPL
ncbi:MAG: hypothetical protein ACLFSB_14400 [Chitinispirillaceae bacterium]